MRLQRDGSRLASKGFLLALCWLSYPCWSGAEAPRRIVSLSPELTEIVFALGAGDRLVGVTMQCDEPPAARAIARVGTFLVPNVELVLAKQPDLVLASPSPGNRRAVEALMHLGLRVAVIEARSIGEARDAILEVSRLLEQTTKGEELARAFEQRIAAVRERVAPDRSPSVFFLVGRNPLIVAGAGTLQDEMIRLAGGKNVGAMAGHGWPRVDLEYLLAQDPEVIVDASMGSEEADNGTFWSRFADLRAVRSGRVFVGADSRLLRAGPRIPEAVEMLARWLHPQRVPLVP